MNRGCAQPFLALDERLLGIPSRLLRRLPYQRRAGSAANACAQALAESAEKWDHWSAEQGRDSLKAAADWSPGKWDTAKTSLEANQSAWVDRVGSLLTMMGVPKEHLPQWYRAWNWKGGFLGFSPKDREFYREKYGVEVPAQAAGPDDIIRRATPQR